MFRFRSNLYRARKSPWGRDRRPAPKLKGPCEGFHGPCDQIGQQRGPRTAYHWNGKGEDPNQSPILCDECADEYHDYWDEMWDDYYAGIL